MFTRSLLVFAAALAWSVTAQFVSAAVIDLRSGVLLAREVPPGLGDAHVKQFRRFTVTMKIAVPGGTHGVTSTCEQPASFARDGWTQGLIAIYGVHLLPFLNICSALFHDERGAHAAYRVLAQLERTRSQRAHVRALRVPRIDVESQALGSTRNKLATYDLVFRHDNAVINLVYLGQSRVSPGQFGHLASIIDTRLK